MSAFEDVIQGLIRKAGVAGVKELEGVLGDLKKEAKTPWKRLMLDLACEAVEKHGISGVELIEKLVDKIGKEDIPDMEFASLRTRSDYLAMLQHLEADDKKRIKDFFSFVMDKIGVIMKAIISGLSA